MNIFLGKPMDAWADIYALLCFRYKVPKSIRDLMGWRPPETPAECLALAFELIEARKSHPLAQQTTLQWIEEFLRNNPYATVSPEKAES